MNVFITGGTGYVGSGLVPRLVAENEIKKITILTRDPRRISPLGARLQSLEKCEFVIGDIRNCHFNLNNIDIVIHLACNYDLKWMEENRSEAFDAYVGGTSRLVQATRRFEVPYFIFFSSATVYGESNGHDNILAHEDFPPRPNIVKSLVKYAGELIIRTLADSSTMFAIVRSPRIYIINALRNHAELTTKFAQLCCNGEDLIIHGNGNQKVDLVNLSDVCDFVQRLMFSSHDTWNQIYNVGSGHRVSVNKLADVYLEATSEIGLKNPTKYYIKVPPKLRVYYLDISKAREKLGWIPCTRLKDGVTELLLDYLKGPGSCRKSNLLFKSLGEAIF